MPKKKDLPSMPFYIGDWKKDPGVQALDRYQKSLWFDMICLMWESEERGFLSFNKDAIPINLLANMLGENKNLLEKNIEFFEQLNLFSRDKRGRIHSRKILNILQLSDKRRLAGLASAQQRVEQKVNKSSTRPPTTSENENENENAIKTVFNCNNCLTQYLLNRVLENRQIKVTDSKVKKWIKDFRIMRKVDKRNVSDIYLIIKECHDMPPTNKGFTWADNILSPEKLRKQWNDGNIYIGMNKTSTLPLPTGSAMDKYGIE